MIPFGKSLQLHGVLLYGIIEYYFPVLHIIVPHLIHPAAFRPRQRGGVLVVSRGVAFVVLGELGLLAVFRIGGNAYIVYTSRRQVGSGSVLGTIPDKDQLAVLVIRIDVDCKTC